jgi:hypothetical protein
MREFKDSTIALNVWLKPSDSSAHPRAANYTNVGVAQGMPLVTRVAMDVSALSRLQQQIQQVLVALRTARQPKAKG